MKIRHGFVSNSSSSSFMIIATTKAFDDTLKKVHPYIAHFVKRSGIEDKKAFGKNLSFISKVVCSEDFDPSDYKGTEALDFEGKVVEFNEDSVRGDLMFESDALCLFAKELEKTDPENFFYNIGYA